MPEKLGLPLFIRKAPEGVCAVGNISHNFLAENVYICSALVLKAPGNRFGLFHIRPWQKLDDQRSNLNTLKHASGILIEGSDSLPKDSILAQLEKEYDIHIVRRESIDTSPPKHVQRDNPYFPFHALFKAKANTIHVARTSAQDVLTFNGF